MITENTPTDAQSDVSETSKERKAPYRGPAKVEVGSSKAVQEAEREAYLERMDGPKIPIKDIVIEHRFRKDESDPSDLVASMKKLGLLHPIVLAEGNRLVAGYRRLKAAKKLKWRKIPYRLAIKIDDALKLLQAERDENTCRKDLLPSEAVALGKEIEKLEKPEAAKRKAATQAKNGKVGQVKLSSPEKGQTRDKVANAVGMSGGTYDKAKAAVEAGEEDPDQFGEIVEEMDRTGKVDPAFKKVKEKKEEEQDPLAKPKRLLKTLLKKLDAAKKVLPTSGPTI